MVTGGQTRIYDSLGNDITYPFSVNLSEPFYKTLIETPSTDITYIGKALQGADSSTSSWAIKKIEDTPPNTSILLSPNFSTFGDKWSERASLTYS